MTRVTSPFVVTKLTLAIFCCGVFGTAVATDFPVTPAQKAKAEQVAAQGVPLSALAANAPDEYTVKKGDTLWAISRLFLKSPWRWPELWGMNKDEIKNPHLIYPGQKLYLHKVGGRAHLSTSPLGAGVVKLSPRVRADGVDDKPIGAVPAHLIEPWLTESVVLTEDEVKQAGRIVAMPENRVMLSMGDLAYARSSSSNAQFLRTDDALGLRLFRDVQPIIRPGSNEVLGYEALYVGRAQLERSESDVAAPNTDAAVRKDAPKVITPASVRIVSVKQEVQVGDRILPQTALELREFVPTAPEGSVRAQILRIHGEAVVNAGQNQVVLIDQGRNAGLAPGHVLSVQTRGRQIVDKTDGGKRELMQLPNETNGLAMVIKSFDKVSYALLLELTDVVKVGDIMINPNQP